MLVGRPLARATGPRVAFFFVGRRFVGRDAATPTARVHVLRAGRRTVTLAYRAFPPSAACCAGGRRVTVRFSWTGERVVRSQPIPPAAARLPAGSD